MRWFFNCVLVLAGLPLVGTTFVLIGSAASTLGEEITGPIRGCLLAVWLVALGLFVLAYQMRTRWLEHIGIYKSWSNFEAYMKENHGHPRISEDEKTEFLSWAELPEERPAQFRKAMRALYRRIHTEVRAEEQRKSYIKCLAWYATGWPVHDRPVHEDCYGPYEDDDWHLTTRDV